MNIIQQVEKELAELVKFREDIEKKNAIKESSHNVEAIKKQITAVFEKKSLFATIKSFFIKEVKAKAIIISQDEEAFIKCLKDNFSKFTKGNTIGLYKFVNTRGRTERINAVYLDLHTFKIFRIYIANESYPSTTTTEEINYDKARALIIAFTSAEVKEELEKKYRKQFILNSIQNETFEDMIKGQ